MIPLYLHRDSWIHRMPAGAKLAFSLICGTAMFFCEPIPLLTLILAATVALYPAARLPMATIAATLKPLMIVGLVIFLLQLAFAGLGDAVRIVLRISAVVLLTSLVSLTTRFSDMLGVLTKVARPLAHFGIGPANLALAAGLTIRFIPALIQDLAEMRQARLARGASGLRSFGAGPLILKILRMTDALGNAIAARGFENRK